MGRPKLFTDEEVLAKAFSIISKEGFDSFTLEQVSEVTGIAPATLIRRFKTKRNLAIKSRDWQWNYNLSLIEKNQLNKSGEGLKGLESLIHQISQSVDSDNLGEHLRLLSDDLANPELRTTATNFFKWTRKIIKDLLDQAIIKGELKDLNSLEMSFHLEALIQGIIFQFAFYPEKSIEYKLLKHINLALIPYKT